MATTATFKSWSVIVFLLVVFVVRGPAQRERVPIVLCIRPTRLPPRISLGPRLPASARRSLTFSAYARAPHKMKTAVAIALAMAPAAMGFAPAM